MTNAEFAINDKHFKDACEFSGVPATTRQASKFRMGKGSAHTAIKNRLAFKAWLNQREINKTEV